MQLFSESPGRVLVSLPGTALSAFRELCAQHGLPVTRLGEVTDTGYLEIHGRFALSLAEVRAYWESPIPTAMRH